MDPSVRIPKRADELVVGDRLLPEFVPAPRSGPVVLLFVRVHEYRNAKWVFVAYRRDDGYHDSTAFMPDREVTVFPADPGEAGGMLFGRGDEGEQTQPVAGRIPPHFESGVTTAAVEDGPVCQGAPAGYETDCGTSGAHGPHPIEPDGRVIGRAAVDGWSDAETGLTSGGLMPNCPTCGGDHHTVEPCR